MTLQAIQSAGECNEFELDEVEVDDPEMCQNLNEDDSAELISTMTAHCRCQRLPVSCFDLTLHLTVGDGLECV